MLGWLSVTLTATTLALSAASRSSPPILRTENGKVSGILDKSFGGKTVFNYLGIPFAQPPIGENRFEEPKRLTDKWNQVWRADRYAKGCITYDVFKFELDELGERNYQVTGSEDCLYLNVFTNQRNIDEKGKNVIVFIHGGGFQYGKTKEFESHAIMDRPDIVFVSIAYRLGPMGFLSTGDAIVPGNNGLKDQIAALQWVKRNIASFGGDPKKVTLSGMSAGGVSVHLMYMSPLAKGLFRRGYSYSGSALCPWVMYSDLPEKTKRLASLLECPTSDSEQTIRCLKQQNARDIVAATRYFQVFFYNPFTVFGPTVESVGSRPFITKSPLQYLTDGDFLDLPWITGVTSGEGYSSAPEYAADEKVMSYVNDHWEELAPSIMFYNETVPVSKHAEVARQVRKAFMGDLTISTTNKDPFVNMVGDRLIVAAGIQSAIYMSRKNRSPVWLSYFRYRGAHTTSDEYTNDSAAFGVGHADDQIYVYDDPALNMRTTESDRAMGNILVDIAEDFAKFGMPPVYLNWKRFVYSPMRTYQYLEINGPEAISMRRSPLGNRDILDRIFGPYENSLPLPSPKKIQPMILSIFFWVILVHILKTFLLLPYRRTK